MTLSVVIPKETQQGELRLALVPEVARKLQSLGLSVRMESNAGKGIGLPDADFVDIDIQDDVHKLYASADIILKVQPPTPEEISHFKPGAVLVSYLSAHAGDERITALKNANITSFSIELVPRISRAQTIDALSSQASAAGYKAVLIAANLSGRFFPMLTTAAGTIRPSRCLIIGAGVAGLQAIATARRLGAIVEAYDVRAATREQVESLGAKFVDMDVKAEGEGGYARALTDEEKAKQQAVLAKHVAIADVVISTAAIPGRKAPIIISQDMVSNMKHGAVIVDIAAESGGNCELTVAGKEILHQGVTIAGPVNLPSQLATHASEMYAKNLFNFLSLIIKEQKLALDWQDQILAESVITHDGQIKHEPTRQRLEGGSS